MGARLTRSNFRRRFSRFPTENPKEFAKRVKLIEINTKGLDSIFYPLTQAEASNWVDPPIYSQMLNLRIKSAWDNTGNVVWNVCKEFSEKAFGGNEVPA